MLGNLWNLLLVNPILNLLAVLYHYSGNLGIAIILLTIIIRTILIPFVLPSLKTMKKQRELQPEIDKLKEKYKHDKQKLAQMQMELFKKHGLNPASGCLTQVAMVVVLIALYNVIRKFSIEANISEINNSIYLNIFKFDPTQPIKTAFLYMNLAKPDPYYVLALLSGIFQLFVSKMTFPYAEAGEKAAQKTPDKKDDFAYNMQEQMLYTMPIMNFLIGMKLPSGVVLYLVATTIYSLVQTYFVSGWGGLKPWIDKTGKYFNLKMLHKKA